jgi:hypothetical protein
LNTGTSATISEHATVAEAIAEIDRLAEQMVRTAARPDQTPKIP